MKRSDRRRARFPVGERERVDQPLSASGGGDTDTTTRTCSPDSRSVIE